MNCSTDHTRIAIERFEQIDSTSSVARRLVKDAAAPITLPRTIVARRQTAGRGRLGRAWASPDGGLWCTLIWPLGDGRALDALGLRIGLACTLTIEDALGRAGVKHDVRLKWPNDVLVDGRKVLGVLVEVIAERAGRWALVGVGINANFERAALPLELCTRATTLRHEAGRDVDLDWLLGALHARLAAALTAPGLDEATLSAARQRLYGVGDPVDSGDAGSHDAAVLLGLSDAGLPVLGPPGG